jgi:hypothetical protein
VAATAVKTFRCPSATPDLAVCALISFSQHHAVNGGISYSQSDTRPGSNMIRPGGTNYLGVAGLGQGLAPWWMKYEGVFCNRTRTTLQSIADGTSNTLFIGETCGLLFHSKLNSHNGIADIEFPPGAYPPAEHSWAASGSLITDLGLAHGPWSSRHQFSSNHTGVVQFALADGSVRPLRSAGTNNRAEFYGAGGNREWWLLQAMAGKADGEADDRSALGD